MLKRLLVFLALMLAASASCSAANWKVSGGQIFAPNGNRFVAYGLNVSIDDPSLPTAALITANFPKINYVRVSNFYPGCSGYCNAVTPASVSAWVTSLTSIGIVVQFSDYPGQGACRTGSDLAAAVAWYGQQAAFYANNPLVWWESQNECGDDGSGSLAQVHIQEYNAVRAAGYTGIFLLCVNDGNPNATTGLVEGNYANMTNVVWDIHFYGWAFPGAGDQAASDSTGFSYISLFTPFTSLDGNMPVILGEDGNATGAYPLANGTQTIQTVFNVTGAPNGSQGFGIWLWYCTCNPSPAAGGGNQIMSGAPPATGVNDGYGSMVQTAIAAGYGPITNACTVSPNLTVITTVGPIITDSGCNTWGISTGAQVLLNGAAQGSTSNVVELAYVSGVIWQKNSSNAWFYWNGSSYTAGTNPLPPPAGSTTWNPADESNVTLSGSNLVATTSSAVGGVRTNTSYSSGNYCGQITATTITMNWTAGIANSSFNLAGAVDLGGDINGIGLDMNSAGAPQAIYFNNISQSTGSTQSTNGDAVMICANFTSQLFWVSSAVMRTATTPWNNSGTANPGTGVGGISFAGLTCPCFLIFQDEDAGGVATLQAAPTFALSLPTGFSAWQTSTGPTRGPIIFTLTQAEWPPRFANDNQPFALVSGGN